MALRFFLTRPVNEKLRANGLSSPVTIHDTRVTGAVLISALAAQANMNEGAVASIFQALSDYLARHLGDGPVIELPGLGTIRADVKGRMLADLPTTKNLTDIKIHVRTSPHFKNAISKYTTIQQIPKVIPSPEIQWADTSLKRDTVTTDSMWGPVSTPTDLPMNLPGTTHNLTLKGKNLIWDVSQEDEGVFVRVLNRADNPLDEVIPFTKVKNTSIVGRRGRQIMILIEPDLEDWTEHDESQPLAANNALEFEVRSRVDTRDLRISPYRLMTIWRVTGNIVMVAPVGFSNQRLTLEAVEFANNPNIQMATPAMGVFPSVSRTLYKKRRQTDVGLGEEQIAEVMAREGQTEQPHARTHKPTNATPEQDGQAVDRFGMNEIAQVWMEQGRKVEGKKAIVILEGRRHRFEVKDIRKHCDEAGQHSTPPPREIARVIRCCVDRRCGECECCQEQAERERPRSCTNRKPCGRCQFCREFVRHHRIEVEG